MTSLILGHVKNFSEFISTFNSLITKFTSLPNHQTYILADDDVTAIRSRGIHLWLYLQFYYQQVIIKSPPWDHVKRTDLLLLNCLVSS